MDCPKCKRSLVRKENQFYYRGVYKPGMVCVFCNALYQDPSDPFLAHVASVSKGGHSDATNR